MTKLAASTLPVPGAEAGTLQASGLSARGELLTTDRAVVDEKETMEKYRKGLTVIKLTDRLCSERAARKWFVDYQ